MGRHLLAAAVVVADTALLAAEYGAGLELVDYRDDPEAARRTINAWVEERTEERIPELLAEGIITETTRLTLVNAVFSAAEIAVLSVRGSRLRELADQRLSSARAALALRSHPEQFLATVQIGITIAGTAAGAFGGSTLAKPLAVALRRLGAGDWAEAAAFEAGRLAQ